MAAQNNNNDKILRMASEKLGVDSESIKKAADSNGEKLLSRLSREDRDKVTQVLSDKELTRQILSSPKAQELIKNFFGDKKDGN